MADQRVTTIASSKSIAKLDDLPDEAIIEVASQHGIAENHRKGLVDLMLACTYEKIEPIFAALQQAAEKHGVGDSVQIKG